MTRRSCSGSWLLLCLLSFAAHAQQALVADPGPLPVVIDGQDYKLDSFILRQPGTGKLPVALITHGALPGNPRSLNISSVKGWVDEMAQRGWLAVGVMRRGYARSDGDVAGDSGSCAGPDVGRYLDAQADDIVAALDAVAHRPDADMTRVIVIGHSAGGAVAIALAARRPAGVVAVVNVAGGLAPRQVGLFQPDPACDAYTSDLVWNFARFGVTAHMPTLWLYSENDRFFRPGLVSRMRAAFTGSGGRVDLVMLPPFKDDGHTLFFASGGQEKLLPELDRFLRDNGLPTWDPAAFAPLLSGLSAEDRLSVDYYLRSLPVEKALALGPSGGVYYRFGRWSLEDARDGVLSYCLKETGAACRLVAEDFRLVP